MMRHGIRFSIVAALMTFAVACSGNDADDGTTPADDAATHCPDAGSDTAAPTDTGGNLSDSGSLCGDTGCPADQKCIAPRVSGIDEASCFHTCREHEQCPAGLACPSWPGRPGCDDPTAGSCDEPYLCVVDDVVKSLTIDPRVISREDTQMTDEYFEITISYAGFTDGIDIVRIFHGDPGNDMQTLTRDEITVDEENATIDLQMPYTWLQGFPTGDYQIGAQLKGPDQASATESELARLTIVD